MSIFHDLMFYLCAVAITYSKQEYVHFDGEQRSLAEPVLTEDQLNFNSFFNSPDVRSIIIPAVFYATAIAILISAYRKKSESDKLIELLRARLATLLEQKNEHQQQQVCWVADSDEVNAMREEAEMMRISEKMCNSRIDEFERNIAKAEKDLKEKKMLLEANQEVMTKLKLELVKHRESTAKAAEKAEITDFEHSKTSEALSQRVLELSQQKEELEEGLSKLSFRFESLEPVLNDIHQLIEKTGNFSVTTIDSILIDPLETEFSGFLKFVDSFKERNHVDDFRKTVEKTKQSSETSIKKIRGELAEKRLKLDDLQGQMEERNQEIVTLKVKLQTISELREKDYSNSSKEVTELRKEKDLLKLQNDDLLKAKEELTVASNSLNIFETENAALMKNYEELTNERENLDNEYKKKLTEVEILNRANETLRRRVMENQHNVIMRNQHSESHFLPANSKCSSPDSLPDLNQGQSPDRLARPIVNGWNHGIVRPQFHQANLGNCFPDNRSSSVPPGAVPTHYRQESNQYPSLFRPALSPRIPQYAVAANPSSPTNDRSSMAMNTQPYNWQIGKHPVPFQSLNNNPNNMLPQPASMQQYMSSMMNHMVNMHHMASRSQMIIDPVTGQWRQSVQPQDNDNDDEESSSDEDDDDEEDEELELRGNNRDTRMTP